MPKGVYEHKPKGPLDPDVLAERFWSKVDTDGPIPINAPELGPCHIWMAGRFENGYGSFWVEGKATKAHRFVFGVVPVDLELDHLCRNRSCVRRSHLEAVTHRENMLRSTTLQTHCVNGHPYDAANTYVHPRGQRMCRICSATARRRYWERRAS